MFLPVQFWEKLKQQFSHNSNFYKILCLPHRVIVKTKQKSIYEKIKPNINMLLVHFMIGWYLSVFIISALSMKAVLKDYINLKYKCFVKFFVIPLEYT